MKTWLVAVLLIPALAAAQEPMRIHPEVQRLNALAARFAPVELRVDLDGLPSLSWTRILELARSWSR
jgi:hypothetical protein